MATPPPPNPIEQLQQRISTLEKEASKPILLKFIEVTTEEKVAMAFGSGKVEGMVANIAANAANVAVNGLKAEFNVFDPVKMFGLQDKYDEWLMNRFRSEERRQEVRDQKPENLLAEAKRAKDEIEKAKNRLAALEGKLDKPRDLRKVVNENRAWAQQQINQLRGRKNPRDDLPPVRRSTPDPSLRQLHQQERQLRATIAHFVRVVKGAVPESAALSEEMAKIERQLKK